MHAPCHVTCRQGVQNNRVFGIPKAILAFRCAKLNFNLTDSGVWVPKIWGFPLTLIVALTTVLRTTVLHCDGLDIGHRIMRSGLYDSRTDAYCTWVGG